MKILALSCLKTGFGYVPSNKNCCAEWSWDCLASYANSCVELSRDWVRSVEWKVILFVCLLHELQWWWWRKEVGESNHQFAWPMMVHHNIQNSSCSLQSTLSLSYLILVLWAEVVVPQEMVVCYDTRVSEHLLFSGVVSIGRPGNALDSVQERFSTCPGSLLAATWHSRSVVFKVDVKPQIAQLISKSSSKQPVLQVARAGQDVEFLPSLLPPQFKKWKWTWKK